MKETGKEIFSGRGRKIGDRTAKIVLRERLVIYFLPKTCSWEICMIYLYKSKAQNKRLFKNNTQRGSVHYEKG